MGKQPADGSMFANPLVCLKLGVHSATLTTPDGSKVPGLVFVFTDEDGVQRQPIVLACPPDDMRQLPFAVRSAIAQAVREAGVDASADGAA